MNRAILLSSLFSTLLLPGLVAADLGANETNAANDAPDEKTAGDDLSVSTALQYGVNIKWWDEVHHPGLLAQVDGRSRFGGRIVFAGYLLVVPAEVQFPLVLGDASLTFLTVRNEHLWMRVGLGMRFVIPDFGPGVNVHCGFDVFPSGPLVLSLYVDAGNHVKEGFVRGHAGVGLRFHWIEPYLGYEFWYFDADAHNVPLGGIRGWF